MKKILLLLTSMAALYQVSLAQQKVRGPVSDQYDRNGLAIMLIEYGDGYDAEIGRYFESISKGTKFDITELPRTTVKSNYSRGAAAGTRVAGINTEVNSVDYGKEIVAWLYSRGADGRMNPSRVLERGHFNATDEDLARIESSKTGREALGDIGFQLINNNYVLFVDYWAIKKTTDNNETSWSVSADGYLYRINYSAETEQRIFDCWIYDDDSAETAEAKKRAWDALDIGVSKVLTVSTTQSYKQSDGGLKAAVNAAYHQLIFQLEKGNDDWMVKAAIYDRKPLRAKIGTKEGLKNGMRFDVYRYSEDRQGRIVSTRKGIVRATTIANNNRVVDKESSAPASEFYQIAGRTVSEGMILRQKNDLGMSIGLGYRAGGQSGLNVKIDYLTKIKTRGTSHYALIDASVNGYRPQKYYDKHGNAPATGEIPTLITAVDAGIGYGIGFRATRYFEIMPHAIVGMAMLFSENNLTDDSALTTNENGELSFLDKTGWFATAGLRLNINVYYPVQIYGGADFTFCFGASDWYLENYEHLKNMGKQRQGLGLFAGVRITF